MRIPYKANDIHFRTWLAAWCVSAVVILCIGLGSGLVPGSVGADTDDAFRFLQIRDFLEGQDWRDVTQYRLGPEGTALHWSRLADLPYLLVAWPLGQIVGADIAVRVSGSTVPFLLWGLYIWALLKAIGAALQCLDIDGAPVALSPMAGIMVSLLAGLVFAPRFGLGSFDHHHLQALMLCTALAATLQPAPAWRAGATAGGAIACSAVIGLEALPVLVGLCGVWAVAWGWSGRREATIAFGGTLAAGCVVGAGVFAADFAMASRLCDGFGYGIAGLLILGGAGLAIAATTMSRATPVGRGLALAAIATGVGIFALTGGQSCLANPMDALSSEVRRDWLDRVLEARPLLSSSVEWGMRAFLLGTLVAALPVVVLAWRHTRPERRPAALFLLGWLGIAILLTFYQLRFAALGLVPAGVVLGAAMAMALNWDTEPLRRMTVVLALALVSLPASHGAMADTAHSLLSGAPELDDDGTASVSDAAEEEICTSPAALERLNALPKGVVMVHFNDAGQVLRHTRHSVLASNYHRGWRDIAVQFELERSTPEAASSALSANGVRYILMCEPRAGEPVTMSGPAGSPLMTGLSTSTVAGVIERDLGLPDGLRLFEVAD